MVCFKCGENIPDDSVFCPDCGTRLDGKVKCKNCGYFNDKELEICARCGARVDGKEYCKNCGAVVDGNFCAQCGVVRRSAVGNSVQTAAVQPVGVATMEKQKTTFIDGFRKVERILSPCLFLFVMLILFCCSFGIGISVDYDSNALIVLRELGVAPKSGGDALYFFGQSFIETASFLTGYADNANYAVSAFGMQLPNVVSLIAIVINFAVVITCFIMGAVKTGVCLKKGQSVTTYKYAITAFTSFLLTSVIVMEANYVYMNYYLSQVNDWYYSNASYYVSMSGGSVLGLLFSVGPMVLAFILSQIAKGKDFKNAANLIKVIICSIMVFFLFIVLCSMSSGVVIDVKTMLDGYAETEYSFSALIGAVCFKGLNSAHPAQYNAQLIEYFLSYVAYLACIVTFAVLFRFIACALFEQKSYRKPIFIMSIVGVALIFLSTIVPLSLYIDAINLLVGSTSGVWGGGFADGITVPFVLSLLILGGAVTYFVLTKNKTAEK